MSLLELQSIRARRWLAGASAALGAVLVAACASPSYRAPVEDRQPARPAPAAVSPQPVSSAASAPAAPDPQAAKPALPGAENAGKPGYYTVQKGDTLIRIGLDNGQPWRDIARWNGLENANLIEVGQVLRVAPPVTDPGGVSTRPVAAAGRVDSRPLDGRAPAPASAASGGGPAASGAASAPAAAAAPPAAATAARESEDDVSFIWPAAGPVATAFEEGKNKGLAITGKAGDAVLAAADGRVVYAGSGLRGYGNLIIVKHNATYLTAYAHNQALLVKEDQAVRKGQKIAEMGSTDADRVQLHFEVRRLGKPVDPARLLPPR
jgi:lipoprotein NlpD